VTDLPFVGSDAFTWSLGAASAFYFEFVAIDSIVIEAPCDECRALSGMSCRVSRETDFAVRRGATTDELEIRGWRRTDSNGRFDFVDVQPSPSYYSHFGKCCSCKFSPNYGGAEDGGEAVDAK
jgi:hypothetical protein